MWVEICMKSADFNGRKLTLISSFKEKCYNYFGERVL